jgi:predicted peptidase
LFLHGGGEDGTNNTSQINVNIDNLLPAVTKDPRFLMANGFQSPIQARFGVKFAF